MTKAEVGVGWDSPRSPCAEGTLARYPAKAEVGISRGFWVSVCRQHLGGMVEDEVDLGQQLLGCLA